MSDDHLVGVPDIPHVKQPEGTELCFASLMAGFIGQDIAQVHDILSSSSVKVSESDGSTSPFMKTKDILIAGGLVTLEPIVTPMTHFDAEDASYAIKAIDKQLNAVPPKPVAMLYQKPKNEGGTSHWVIVEGHKNLNDNKGSYKIFDPQQARKKWSSPRGMETTVKRSLDASSLYAYALSKTGITKP